jgi:anti-anti-sigma factor
MGVAFDDEIVDQGLHKITLVGTLDAPGTMEIENEFQNHLLAVGGMVVVDLSHVDYMSSYGLRMFLLAAKALHNSGGQLHLAAPNQNVMQIIHVAGYDTMFPVYETLEEALLYLRR